MQISADTLKSINIHLADIQHKYKMDTNIIFVQRDNYYKCFWIPIVIPSSETINGTIKRGL